MDKILEKIKQFATQHDAIHTAVLNGSRCNDKVKQDAYQDYDVWFLVDEPKAFIEDDTWLTSFGPILMKQVNVEAREEKTYIFCLVLFESGVRIDFSFIALASFNGEIKDSLSKVLLDKKGILPNLKQPSDQAYWIQKPSQSVFQKTSNNFYWCLTNMAKGLARGEVPYYKGMLEQVIRPELLKMIRWHIGIKHNWQVNLGSFDKWLENYLEKPLYNRYLKTYVNHAVKQNWQVLFDMHALFSDIAIPLAKALNMPFDQSESQNVLTMIKSMK